MSEIRQQLFTESDCFREGRYINPKGIMVHSTGAPNPYLRRYLHGDEIIGYNQYRNHWDMPGIDVCVHGFIGLDLSGQVRTYQTLPWNMRGWHCAGTGNDTHISFEICEDDLTDADYFRRVYAAAVELCAHLCQQYDLTADTVICHAEGAERGIASNHADVRHWFSRFGVTMDDFRSAVAEKLNERSEDMTRYTYLADIPNDYGFRDIVNTLMDAEIIGGDGSDSNGNGDVIDLSHDQVRSLVFEYRGGAFDRKLISKGIAPAVPV